MNFKRIYTLFSTYLQSLAQLLIFLLIFTGCGSYETFKYITEEFEMPARLYRSNYNKTWAAILQVMEQFDIENKSQEAGIIKTMWIDNTTQLNFVDSFGSGDQVKSAKFKIILNAVKGAQGAGEVTKVTIFKRQLVEQDILQGWKEIPTDNIQEKTLLYLIGRKIFIDEKMQEIEKEIERKQEANF